MKVYVKLSAGDVSLCKFIFIPSKFIEGVCEENYDRDLQGYLWLWSYTYNKFTHQTDDRLYAHSEIIDNLPIELRRVRDSLVWGRVDWYGDRRRFFVNYPEGLNSNQLATLKRMCNCQ